MRSILSSLKVAFLILVLLTFLQCSAADGRSQTDAATDKPAIPVCKDPVPNKELPIIPKPNADMSKFFADDADSQAFMRLVQANDLRGIRKMVEKGYDINRKGQLDFTPITIYVSSARPLCLETYALLLDLGANVSIPSSKSLGSIPLIIAIAGYANNSSLLHLALEKGADPNIYNSAAQIRSTPLHAATLSNNVENIRLLLDSGSDPDRKNVSGKTALVQALLLASFDGAEYLLRRGIKTDGSDEGFNVALATVGRANYQMDLYPFAVTPEKRAQVEFISKTLRDDGYFVMTAEQHKTREECLKRERDITDKNAKCNIKTLFGK